MIKQKLNSCKINHFLGGFISLLVVSRESTETIEPCESTLYNPAERFWSKAFDSVWRIADFKLNVEIPLYCINNFPSVTSVSKNPLDGYPYIFGSAYKFVYEPGIMDTSRVNTSSEDKSFAVHNDAALYPLDAFVRIEAVGTLMVIPFDALSIKCSYSWNIRLFSFSPYLHYHLFNTEFYTPVLSPFGEMPVYRLPFRKVFWLHPPLTPGDHNEENGLKDGAERIFTVAAIIFKEYFVYIRPLTLGQMCLIEAYYMHINRFFSSINTLIEGFIVP